MKYSDLIIQGSVTVCDAMRAIDENGLKIVFAADGNRLIGAITDGDIRRYLYKGGKIDDPAENAANHSPRIAGNIAEARELYDSFSYIAIPVLDKNGNITDIYIGDERRCRQGGFANLNIPVVINAGGRGTRLDPFTRVLPKPLIPVGELPIIEHIMQQFSNYGCSEFSVIVNYKKELIKTYFRETETEYKINWYDEEKPLGTGGGISLLRGKLNSTFFFTNCDTLLLSDYDSIIRTHKDNRNDITMICAWKNLTIPYGVVEMGLNGTIENMKEKPEMSFLTNTGMYIIEPEILDEIPDNTPLTMPEIIQKHMDAGGRVAAYPVSESEWLDMGQLSELEKMRERLYGK